MNRNKDAKTPSEFYRKLRPEYFSDSERVLKVLLPKEHLAFELHQISKNQKQDAFETLARRLAEKFISPNLIPQVGPTGGGDGKTDSESHPVSSDISNRWFVPQSGWQKDEKWAFAISAKEDWAQKLRLDVEKIIGTNRGYTKIFFITNQLVSSKKKKEAQDRLSNEFKIEIIILDREWILEKVFTNDLTNLVVESLNLSEAYKTEQTIVGSNDAYRLQRFQELEEKVNTPNRYFEYDYQLVEDALESAILSRMLEKPKEEIYGRFDRALRLAKIINNTQQLLRVLYQKAWTDVYWFDDFQMFLGDFNQFKQYLKEDITINSLELYYNLFNTLNGISEAGIVIDGISIISEEEDIRNTLSKHISNTNKPSMGIVAKSYDSLLNIFQKLKRNEDPSQEIQSMGVVFLQSKGYLEFPFDSIKKIFSIIGEIVPDNECYDNVVEIIAALSEERASQVSSAETYLNRGIQKLENGLAKQSIVYFGKSILKFSKSESIENFQFSLRLLGAAYKDTGLFWASHNCFLSATAIALKEFYDTGKPSLKLYKTLKQLLELELMIGRIPYILSWFELINIISTQVELTSEDDLSFKIIAEGCLAVRLLNSDFIKWDKFEMLPDIFKNNSLFICEDTILYMLGHLDKLDLADLGKLSNGKSLDECYQELSNQPFKQQIVYGTNLLESDKIYFEAIILGAKVHVLCEKNKNILILSEMILAFIESLLATSIHETMPTTENIYINIKENGAIEWYQIEQDVLSNTIIVYINSKNVMNKYYSQIRELLMDIVVPLLARNFMFRDIEKYLKNLFEVEEIHERQSIIFQHYNFTNTCHGDNPKIILQDWYRDSFSKYAIKRSEYPMTKVESTEKRNEILNYDTINHQEVKALSIIDSNLWDTARWIGFGILRGAGIPFGLFLAFENGEAGKKIFEQWIAMLGTDDIDDKIYLSIIRGINKFNPYAYRVHVTKSIDELELKRNKLLYSISNVHQMDTTNPQNLTDIISQYERLKRFQLFPAHFKMDADVPSVEPYLNLGITKRKLIIKEAWQIGMNDFDSAAIKADDSPIIPNSITDAPLIELLEKKKNSINN